MEAASTTSRVDALGPKREVEVAIGGQAGLLEDRHDPLVCGSGVGGRLEYHPLLALQDLRERCVESTNVTNSSPCGTCG